MQRAQVKCTLCFDDFMEPRKLTCGETHIFCTKCLHHHIRTSAENGEFRCPARHPDCNAVHHVPENGITGIRNTFPIVDIQVSEEKCPLCADEFVEVRKLPCSDGHIFCTKCLHHHIRVSTENGKFRCPAHPDCNAMHNVPENGVSGVREKFPLVIDEVHTPEQDDKIFFCKEDGHESKEMIVYCKKHEKMICGKCLSESHEECKYSQFEEEVPRQKLIIEELLVKVKKYTDDLEKIIADTKAAYGKSDQDIDEMKNQVEITFQEVVSIVTQKKSELLEKIDKIKRERNQEEITSSQQKQIQNAEKITSSCIDIQKQTEMCGILEESTAVKQEWESLYTQKVNAFSWEFTSEELTKQCDDWLGVVSSSHIQDEMWEISPSSQSHSSNPLSVVKDINMKNQINVSGIVEVDDVLLVTHEKCGILYVYGIDDCNTVAEVSIPGLKNPWGGLVCLSVDPKEIVISDSDSRCLHLITLSRKWDVTKHRKQTLNYVPYDVAKDKASSSDFFVSQSIGSKIHAYNKEGIEQCSFQMGSGEFGSPRSIVALNDYFIVCDFSRKKVTWLDKNGLEVKSYAGSEKIKLQCPFKISSVPRTQHVLVSDSAGHAIHEVNDQGQCVCVLATKKDGVKKPFGIHLGMSGKLYVSTTSSSGLIQIRVFQYRSNHLFATISNAHNVKIKLYKCN